MSRDEQPTLILVPTPMELEQVTSRARALVEKSDVIFELCGFGPIAAAARSMHLVNKYNPSRVVLVGIAGAFDERLPVGAACCFKRVVCDGVGVGSGSIHESATALGWNQWTATAAESESVSENIGDVIELAVSTRHDGTVEAELLTVCSASANCSDAAIRRQRHPSAAAEDMEGFGVAMACRMVGVQLQVVRGISNRVGDRNKANWNINEALRSAARLLEQMMAQVLKEDREHSSPLIDTNDYLRKRD